MSGNNSVSSEESSSHRSGEEKENSGENPTPDTTNVPADVTEMKRMLETLAKKVQDQEKQHEATTSELQALKRKKLKRTRARPTRLRFTTPRPDRRDRHEELPPWTDRTGQEDLPPPPPRRDSDENPERVVEDSDEDQPPQRRARTDTAAENARAREDQHPPRRHTREYAADNTRADGEGDPSIAELYRRGQERRTPQGSRDEEVAALKARLDQVVSDLRTTKLQMYRSTGKAPGVAYVLEKARNTPFAESVARTQISDPGKIKLPIYEGTTDPSDHLLGFEVALGRANFTEAEKDVGYYKLFVESLKGPALQWFYKLEKNSIYTFHQLSEMFLQHYNIFAERRIYDAELWTNKQGENESLRSFITRFKHTLSKVDGISNTSALEALREALRCPSPFWQELTVNPPMTIQDALHRATDFARSEEEVRAKMGGKARQASAPTQTTTPPPF